MKKFTQKKKSLFHGIKFKISYDPNLDKINPEDVFPEKNAEANRILKNMKLPESFTNSTKK